MKKNIKTIALWLNKHLYAVIPANNVESKANKTRAQRVQIPIHDSLQIESGSQLFDGPLSNSFKTRLLVQIIYVMSFIELREMFNVADSKGSFILDTDSSSNPQEALAVVYPQD